MKRSHLEVFCFALLSAVCVFSFRSLLFTGTSTLPHDNLYWFYPLFQHYAESLLNGQLPLWNPYEHGGEPFYPVLISGRFLDPLFPLTVWLGGFFTRDTVILLHWTLFIEAWFTLLGSYLFFRALTRNTWARLATLPVLFFSIFMLGWLRQPGMLLAFTWIPFVAYYLLRVTYFEDRRLANWILLGAFIGVNWQFYYFAGTWLLLLFFGLGLLAFHRKALVAYFQTPGSWKLPALSLFIASLMVAPNASLYFSQGDFVFPARMMSVERKDKPVRGPINREGGPENLIPAVQLPYSVLAYTGTVACLWDYLQALLPEAAFRSKDGWDGTWRIYHDGHGYLGVLFWAIACAGIFLFRSAYRSVALFALGGLALFTLGPGGGIHRLLYAVYPPAQFMRHTILLLSSVYLLLLVPFVGGLEYVFRLSRREIPFPKLFRRDLFWLYGIALGAALLAILRTPELEDWAWFPLLVVALAGWSLRERISPLGYWIALTVAPIAVAFSAAPNLPYTLIYSGVLLGLPLASLWFRGASLTLGIVSVLLVFDFGSSFQLQSLLWETKPHPASFLAVKTTVQPPKLPITRRLFAPGFSRDPQSIRYLATAFREPTALSTLYRPADTFEAALKVPRWNSFLLPKHYFELIHSGLTGQVLERMFALERRLFQFKQGAIEVPDSGYSEIFPQGEPTVLDSYVLVPPGTLGLPLFDPQNVDLAAPSFSYRAKEYAHGNFTLETSSAKAGVLYFADGYDPSWTAYVDDKATPVARANKNFKAIALPAGEHEVRFVYRPWGFLIAAGLFYFVFFGSLLSALGLSTLPAWSPLRRSLVRKPLAVGYTCTE